MPKPDMVANYGTFPPDWSVGVLYAGREVCAASHSWEGVRDHYVLHLVLSGLGRAKWGRRSRTLSRGRLFLIRPGERIFYQADADEPWSYAWIGFAGVHAGSLTRLLPDDERAPCLETHNLHQAESYFNKIAQTLETARAHSSYRAAGLLLLLLAQLEEEREAASGRRTSAEDLVQEARAFIDQNFQREIDVADVISHIGVDRSHFSRVFRTHVGTSIQDYLIQTRMERARRLLQETSLPVRAVAASVGYRTYGSFSRRFHRYFGETAGSIRQ